VPETSDVHYTNFADVPWFRRSWMNLIAAVVGLFIPPLLWAVCVVLFTGPVYTPKKDESGNLMTWGEATKWVVLIVAGLQLFRLFRDGL